MKRPVNWIVFVGLALLLVACAGPADEEVPQDPLEIGYSPEWLSGLSRDTILIQQSYEPTYYRQEAFYSFGRVPVFTLYADGTVMFIAAGDDFSQQQLFTARLSPEETLGMLKEFMDLGFENLEDYLDMCTAEEDGSEVCIADASYIVLSGLLSTGELRTVKSYGNFSNDPAALEEIRLMLNAFSPESGEPFSPQQATLFVSKTSQTLDRFEFPWPLDPGLLQLQGPELNAVVLEATELNKLIETVGRNMGDFYFEVGGEGYVVYLVPWLRGEDYSAEIAAEFKDGQRSENATPTPAPVQEFIFDIEHSAISDLADRLGFDHELITVYEIEQVDWPDGCLGIATAGTACTEAIVPGFRLLLKVDGVSYEYRSNMDGSLLVAADPMLSTPLGQPEAIAIAAPGPGSRVKSPVVVSGEADPTFEQTLVVRILLMDGTIVAEEPAQIQAEFGLRGFYSQEIAFEVENEEQGFIQVYAVSARDGGVTHLNSVGVLLADQGDEIINPGILNGEQIRIDRPSPGETINNGVLHIAGYAIASFEQTLVVDVILEDGTVLERVPIIVQAPDLGMPGLFTVDIPINITSETAGRIVVRDPSPAFSGDVHITSVEVRFIP